MPTHDNTKNLPFLPPVLNKFDEKRLTKEASALSSDYYIAMMKHDGGMVIFLEEPILLPGRGNKPAEYSSVCTRQGMLIPNRILRSYLEYLNAEYKLSKMIGEIHSIDENLSLATSILSDEKVTTIDPKIRLTLFNYVSEGGFEFRHEFIRQTAYSIINKEDLKFVRPAETFFFTKFSQIDGILNSLTKKYGKVEGLVLTHQNAPYIGGVRGKVNPHAMKYVPLQSGEFEVIGVVERKYGKNLKTPGTEHLWGKPKGDLGSLICKIPNSDLTFNVGTGFTNQQRLDYWTWRDPDTDQLVVIGKYAMVEYQDIGSNGRPTKPRFKGWRSDPSGDYITLEGR